jgi:diadenosine tetraphosphate (Ap4A) HIT family hydrolase
MALNAEQLKHIRQQLLKQLESLPPQQASSIRNQISGMNDEQFEQFLIQNKMIKEGEDAESEPSEEKQEQKCVFCSIIEGKVPSHKLGENKSSLAILEINPLSKGHSLVLSKNHNKLPSSSFSLANKIAKRLKSKLKPEEVKIESDKVLGHNLIQIIPIYKDSKLEKKKANDEELILLKDKLHIKKKEKKKKSQNIQEIKLELAPKRVP